MKLKILYFFNSGGVVSAGLSGGDVRFMEIAKRIQMNYGNEIHILTTTGGQETCKVEELKAIFYLLPIYFLKKESNKVSKIYSLLITIFTSFFKTPLLPYCDIAYTTSDIVTDTIPAWIYKRKYSNAKWIAMVHHRYNLPWKRKGNLLLNFLGFASQRISFKLIRNCADAIFVYRSPEGKQIQDYFLKRKFSNKIFEVENGIPFHSISQISVENEKFDACFAAGLRESKGMFDLIKIWKLVCIKKKDASLVVIGSGRQELLTKMQTLVNKYGLYDNVYFTGLIPHGHRLFETVKSSSIFISPSYEEGWGIAVCEAMGCGLPVVAWDLPVYKRLFPKGMITVPVGDIEEFAGQVVRLLNDIQLRRNMVRDAVEVASRYDWDDIAERELKLMESIGADIKR